MNTYHITIHSKLFSINRVVEATSKVEAAKTVAEYMPSARLVWIEDITGCEYED